MSIMHICRTGPSVTYHEAFILQRLREVAVECHSIVIGIVALFSDNVFQEGCLVSENL